MTLVTFVTASGAEMSVDVEPGVSVMKAALNNSVPGIDGDCGGCAACGTCHVYIDPAWIERTGRAADGDEAEMLSFAEEVDQFSRLACQVIIDDRLEGLVVRIPAAQH